MFILSLVVLGGCIVGIFFQGGEFNLGIDFVGGVNQQIQLANVALSVSYTGNGTSADAVIRNKQLAINYIEQGELKEVRYNFTTFATVQDLANEINKSGNFSAQVREGFGSAAATRLLSTDYSKNLLSEPVKINIALADEGNIFATRDDIITALAPMGKIHIQPVGPPLNQEFIIKVQVAEDKLKAEAAAKIEESSETEETTETVVDEKTIQEEKESQIIELLSAKFETEAILIRKSDYIGPSFSVELVNSAVMSIVVAFILILLYITVRFKFGYALGALAALVHDISIMIVVIGAFQLEVTPTTIAAILTIIGYSLNDTIVVYDRIRENFQLYRDLDRESVINTSITQSLSRTLITSITTLLAVIAIYIFGTGVIKDFSFNLIIGILVGTYSSIFIASPVVLSILNAQEKRKKALAAAKAAPAPSKKKK